MIRVLVVILLIVVACDGSSSAGPSSVSGTTEPPSVLPPVPKASEVPPDARATPPASEPPAPTCTPPLRVQARTLATSWPAYLGRRVSLSCRALRRIDFTRTIVVSDGARFVVVSAPDMTPCSDGSSKFTVMGSSVVDVAGRTALPELLLEDGDGCAP